MAAELRLSVHVLHSLNAECAGIHESERNNFGSVNESHIVDSLC